MKIKYAGLCFVIFASLLISGGCSKSEDISNDSSNLDKSEAVAADIKIYKEIWTDSMGDYRGENTKDGRCPKCGMKLEKEVIIRGLKKDEIGKEYFCPVKEETFTGSAVTKAGEYKDKTYYFCCNWCPDEFAKTPEKYIKKEDKQEMKEDSGGHHH